MQAHDIKEYSPAEGHLPVISYCRTCGGEEKELPRECPGQMTQSQKNAVARGDADYYNGTWHRTEKARA